LIYDDLNAEDDADTDADEAEADAEPNPAPIEISPNDSNTDDVTSESDSASDSPPKRRRTAWRSAILEDSIIETPTIREREFDYILYHTSKIDIATAVIRARTVEDASGNVMIVLNDVLKNFGIKPFREEEFRREDGALSAIVFELILLVMRRWAPTSEQRTFWKWTVLLYQLEADETNNKVVVKDGVLVLKNMRGISSEFTLFEWFNWLLDRKAYSSMGWKYRPNEGSFAYDVLESINVCFDVERYNRILDEDIQEFANNKIVTARKNDNEDADFDFLSSLWREEEEK
jgi:hypothetical protein